MDHQGSPYGRNLYHQSRPTDHSDRWSSQRCFCHQWIFVAFCTFWGFPGGSSGKESAYQCRRCRFDPWVLLPEERCVQVQVLQQRVLAAACVKVSISGPPPPFLPPCHLVQVWKVKVKVRGPNRWAGGLGLLPYWVSPSAGSHLNVNPRIFTETHRIYDRGAEEGFELQILTWGGGSDRAFAKRKFVNL